jgi:hypothetical protein
MGSEPTEFRADPVQTGAIDREVVAGEEIQRRVQAMIDADPDLGACDKRIIAPMPKPTAGESPTGCNWHMHYRGQFTDCEDRIDRIVEIVQNEVNIGGPVSSYLN